MHFSTCLVSFGIEPDKIVFINVRNEKDKLWAMEEALKYNGLSAVVGEMQKLVLQQAGAPISC
jgi:protein ImuA